MPGIVGTVPLPGEFLVHGNVPRRVGIVATPRIVGIRAAYQQALVHRVGQNADVVLTIGLIGSFEWFESLLNYRERICEYLSFALQKTEGDVVVGGIPGDSLEKTKCGSVLAV